MPYINILYTVKSDTLECLEKIDISLRANFYLFTVIDIKVSYIDINHVGNIVYQKHMEFYACTHFKNGSKDTKSKLA